MSKSRVRNPLDGTEIFATIPAVRLFFSKTNTSLILEAAPVYLLEGKHHGPHRGFGVVHIWAEHEKEIKADGFKTIIDVPAYVANILRPPSVIYFEDRDLKNKRVSTVRLRTGSAFLEYFPQTKENPSYWSVVTAYSHTRTRGSIVGSLLGNKEGHP